jgi:SpoU rRNA methylase family enzyme
MASTFSNMCRLTGQTLTTLTLITCFLLVVIFSATNAQQTMGYIYRFALAFFTGEDKIVAGKQLYDALEEHYGDTSLLVVEIQELDKDLTFIENICSQEEDDLANYKELRTYEEEDNADIRELAAYIEEIEGCLEHLKASIVLLKAKKETIGLLQTTPPVVTTMIRPGHTLH